MNGKVFAHDKQDGDGQDADKKVLGIVAVNKHFSRHHHNHNVDDLVFLVIDQHGHKFQADDH